MPIYLDNSATSYPKPDVVYDAVNDFMRNNGSSPGRGNYMRAMQAEKLVYDTRKGLSKLLGIGSPSEIVFTSNATEAINIVLKGFLNTDDAVLTSSIEHNAMWRPIKSLERERGVKASQFKCLRDGSPDMDDLKKQLSKKPKLLAMLHGSNVLGNIMPLKDIVDLAQSFDVPVLVDAAQTAGLFPINITELGIEFFAFTGHKGLLGPTGTGGLYIKKGMELKTYKEGGTGSMSKTPYQPENTPDRFEAGTLNTMGIAGLNASVSFLLEKSVAEVFKHENELIQYCIEGLGDISDIQIYGPAVGEERLGLVSFNVGDINPYDISKRLDDEYDIMTRAGLHCAPLVHGITGTADRGAVRVSVGYSNTIDDMDSLVSAIKDIAAS